MPALRLNNFLAQRLLTQFPWCEVHARRGKPAGRGVRNGLPAKAQDGYVWRGEGRAAERQWLDNIFEGDGELMPAGHPRHMCVFCGGPIEPREKEIVIPPAFTGGKQLYQHARWERCLEARERETRSGNPPYGGILERAGLPSPPGGSALMASETDQVLRAARAKGYRTEQSHRNGHWFIINPHTGEKLITMPATPSDYRAIRDTKLRLGRLPDLKQQDRERRKAAAMQKIAAAKPAQPAGLSSAARAMAAEGHLSLPGIRAGEISVSAWWLWENLRRKGADGGRRMDWEGRTGWHWDGFTSTEIQGLWPKLPPEHDSKVRMEAVMSLVQYLKATGHLATLMQHGPKYPAEYWIADTWHGGPDSLGKAVAEGFGRKTSAGKTDHVAAVKAAIERLWETRPDPGAAFVSFGTQDVVAIVPKSTARSTVSATLASLADDPGWPLLSRYQNIRGKWAYQPAVKERTPPVAAPEPSSGRRPGLRLEVLRDMEAHPNVIQSIDDVNKRLGANRGSVSAALLDWYRRGFIEQIGQGLYIKRSGHEEEPEEAHVDQAVADMELDKAEVARTVVPSAPAAPTAAPPTETVPAARGRVADLLRMRPDACLYAEVFRTADGTIIVVDENGDMHELRGRGSG